LILSFSVFKGAFDKLPLRLPKIARLVMLSNRKSEATEPEKAPHYFYSLRYSCIFKSIYLVLIMQFSLRRTINIRAKLGTKDDSLFTYCVIELVLESTNFDLLLSRLEPNGSLTPEILNHFKGTRVYSILLIFACIFTYWFGLIIVTEIYVNCLLTRSTSKK